MYLRAAKTRQLLPVEVDPESVLDWCLEDAPGLLDGEDALLAEHVHVLHVQLAARVQSDHLGQLAVDHVVGSLVRSLATVY